jgi:hypothetical protein
MSKNYDDFAVIKVCNIKSYLQEKQVNFRLYYERQKPCKFRAFRMDWQNAYVCFMNLERYEIKGSTSLMEFEFISIGKKGDIIKVVQYSPTGIPNIFNLGFGDKDVRTGKISDTVISDNGDGQMVLATVANTVIEFMKKHPSSQIIAVGVSKSRTRLYQIGIFNNHHEIVKSFKVYGYIHGKWEIFEKSRNYEAFLVRKKD